MVERRAHACLGRTRGLRRGPHPDGGLPAAPHPVPGDPGDRDPAGGGTGPLRPTVPGQALGCLRPRRLELVTVLAGVRVPAGSESYGTRAAPASSYAHRSTAGVAGLAEPRLSLLVAYSVRTIAS